MIKHSFNISPLEETAASLLLVMFFVPSIFSFAFAQSALDETELKETISKVAAYQALQPMVPDREDRAFPNGWIPSTFYSGLMDAAAATGDETYIELAEAWAVSNDWNTGPRPLHADDLTCGQVYLALYGVKPDAVRIEGVQKTIETVMTSNPSGRELWDWCDALFMAPPALAGLGSVTGNKDYLKALHQYYWDAADYLFDREEELFYRDNRYFFERSATCGKIFWSRGNGWVTAGLVRTLKALPDDYKHRERYEELLKTLCRSLLKHQQPEGLWYPDITCPERFPMPETSGSGFILYGMLYGIRTGLLNADQYLPAALKGMDALLEHIDEQGKLGYVQQVGHDPVAVKPGDNQAYGAGALLMAASELILLQRENPELFTP